MYFPSHVVLHIQASTSGLGVCRANGRFKRLLVKKIAVSKNWDDHTVPPVLRQTPFKSNIGPTGLQSETMLRILLNWWELRGPMNACGCKLILSSFRTSISPSTRKSFSQFFVTTSDLVHPCITCVKSGRVMRLLCRKKELTASRL